MESLENDKLVSARKYLETQGLNLDQTALLSVIDGYMRSCDLCFLMEDYAKRYHESLNVK